MNALLVCASLILIILYLIYFISKRKFDYWKKKNVPYLKPLPILGNYGKYILLKQYPGHVVQKLCQQFPDQPYFGAFFGTEPVLVALSPEIFRCVLTKDFASFHGREVSKYTAREVITRGLFFTSGDKWKIVRQNISPLFSSAKMKNMFYLIEKCARDLEDMLDRETNISDVISARPLAARYTMDCICSCAFGVEANTMKQTENNPFAFMANEIFEASNYRGFKIIFRAIWPAIFYGLGFKVFPPTINTFFSRLLKGVFESRNYEPSQRNDFVDLILNLKKEEYITADSINNANTGENKKIHLKMDDDFLSAQSIVFFAAGFETSAATISFTLYEFAKNPDVQRRAAKEVDEYLHRHGNKLNYECLTELPYLESCVYETLRMYPVLANVARETMADCVLPTGLRIDKGVRVHIPVFHIHHNPDYFPEPEKYNPERFMPENRKNLKPYTFFPYGEGPRICIGKRFSKMQVISGLVTYLKKYNVELAEGMTETVNLDARTWITQPKDQPLWLRMMKREGWEQRTYVRA